MAARSPDGDVLRIDWADRSPYLLTVRIRPVVAMEFEKIITSLRFGPLRNVSRPRKVSPLPKSVINRLPNHHVLTLDGTLLRDLHSFLESSKNSLAFTCPFRIVTLASPREVSHACAIDPERGVASRAGAREDNSVFDQRPLILHRCCRRPPHNNMRSYPLKRSGRQDTL